MDPAQAPAAIEFGRFRVLPHRRELIADGRPLEVGGRAFDVLMVLIEASGAVVSKGTLMNRVWPDRIIEENSLQHQISTLRRVFAADRDLIRTIAGRGYQFTGEIRTVAATPNAPASAGMAQATPTPFRPPTNLPEPVSELIGRDAELDEILNLSASHRLVTLTGAGGIGKTRLGFEAARHLLPRFADGIWGIELAPLSDPELVPVTVATALGLELASGTASPLSVANALRAKQLMLVLDNCEHVVDAAARTAEALLRANPAARVIATSREPLTAAEATAFPAVQLFVERVIAIVEDFALTDANAPLVSEICRRLDGLPLAIEFAAPRVEVLGIEGVGAHLDDSLPALGARRRTALPRHRTMRAVVDWSYGLLSEDEQQFFRALGIFAGGFTVDAAAAVVLDAVTTRIDAIDRLADLVAKSLVVADVSGAQPRFRLLDTTRAYAIEKLDESAERDQIARRHAEYYRELLEIAATGAAPGILAAEFTAEIDNIRAALVWAFSDDGNPSIAIALASASAQLLLELSLLPECQQWTSKALALLSPQENGTRREMVLQVAFGISFRFTKGATEEVHSRVMRALELAEQFDDADYKLRILHVHGSCYAWRGDLRAALAIARQCEAFAASVTDPSAQPVADRMLGIVQFYLGDLTGARAHLERALGRFPSVPRRNDLLRFGADQRLVALSHKSRSFGYKGLRIKLYSWPGAPLMRPGLLDTRSRYAMHWLA